jgi:hypothetical protein
MLELLDVMNAIPQPLKAGWAVWLVCGTGLVLWHRSGRDTAMPAVPASRPRARRTPKPLVAVAELPMRKPSPEPVHASMAAPETLPLEIHSARVPAGDQQSATA